MDTAALLLLASLALAAPAKKSEPTVNTTGYWVAGNAGFYGHMKQTGSSIAGCCGSDHCKSGTCYLRGTWSDDVLLLVTLAYDEAANDMTCRREVFAARKKSPTTLVGKWVAGGNKGMGDGINRESGDPGPATAYPYENELKLCGDLMAYELVFPSGSAELKSPDAAVLTRIAEQLRKDEKLKLRVVGHTDNTGDAEKNKALSEKRAQSVKKRLVTLAGCQEDRIVAEGLGQESPLEENDTPEGRAINRRVEISVAR